MLTLQLQILTSLTKAASTYADLYTDLLRAYQPAPESGRSWYRPPGQDPFSSSLPFMMAPNNFAFAPLFAFAMLSPMAWQNQSSDQSAMYSAPLAMMNFWSQAWGVNTAQASTSQPAAQMWPWGFGESTQSALSPSYGVIKMSITFPDATEIKFAFPGPPA